MNARTHRRVGSVLLATLVASLLVVAAMPATDAVAEDTITTFEVAAGGLAITAPPSTVHLGSAAAPGTVSSQLGQVTVDDTRGVLLGGHNASVESTSFITGDGTEAETVPTTAVTYSPGLGTPSGTVVCTQALVGDMAAKRIVMTGSAATGTNSCAWNPTVEVTVPAAAPAGTYTGTITHSVA